MTTLTLNLLYEEIIMLQDILVMLGDSDFELELDETEREIFSDLYAKVIDA